MNLPSRVVAATAVLALAAAAMPSAAQDADSAAAVAQPDPITFPRTLTGDAGTVVIHTPQIDSWKDFASIEGRLAIAVTPAGEDEPVLGVAEFTADTDPNLELRVVAVENTEITVTSFPVSDAGQRERLDAIVRSTVQHRTQYVPLDVILTYIAPNASVPEEQGLSFEPPPVFYSTTPAVLVMTEGEPLLAPLPDTKLQYVVNTNWDLFRYKDKEWYLRNDDRWLKNKELSGEWRYDSRLPGDFKKLPDDGNWAEVKAANPPAKGDSAEPTVFVSNRPAELIVVDGQPDYRTAGNASLQYIKNTESDVFHYQAKFYYLVSGRWFRADQLRGPWVHVQELPEVFASIDPQGVKGHVLAAVSGTDEARLAVLEASIPRKASVSRDAGDKVNVFFQGEPVFEEISGTSVQRAVNSSNDIFKVGDEYYLCDNAVWYVTMSTDGPWVVADSIPAAIYSIPPSSPSYHVTHVHVYESDCRRVTQAVILACPWPSASPCTAAVGITRRTTAITHITVTRITPTIIHTRTATADRPGTTRARACTDARAVFTVPMVATVAQRRTTRKPARTRAAGPFGTTTKLPAGALLTTRGRAMVSPPIAMQMRRRQVDADAKRMGQEFVFDAIQNIGRNDWPD
jgi:hypothetical protein